ncbi:MAG: arginine--tRNA ligase [Thermoplasmata archaeon]
MASPSRSAALQLPDPWAPILTELVDALELAARKVGLSTERDVLQALLDLDGGPQGDIALPVHRLAGGAKWAPNDLAAAIASAWGTIPSIDQVSADGAFVNFRVSTPRLARETLERIATRGDRYGGADGPGPSAIIEHTSANPTGPLHVGRVRNGILGDSLARVMRAMGSPVVRQYYVDDLGRQAAMITWIWSKPPAEWPAEIAAAAATPAHEGPKADEYYGRPYPFVSAYVKTHPAAQSDLAQLVQAIEEGHAPPLHHELCEKVLAGMLATLARLGIEFDDFVWESSLLRDGEVDAVMSRLDALPSSVEEENGARALDLARYGLPKESARVVYRRGNGTSLYLARDVAFHLKKLHRADRVVDVFGQDHRLHARTLDAFLGELGEPRRPIYIIYQDITAPGGGRMSTRGGSAVLLDDLLRDAVQRARAEVKDRWEGIEDAEVDRIAEAVGTGAVRFHILRVAAEKPVPFDWEEALSFEGRSGPFVQYSYARAGSILRKSEVTEFYGALDPSLYSGPHEAALIRVLARLPRTLAGIVRTNHVHTLASYAHDLADEFNRFYHAVPVLHSEPTQRASRLTLVAATRQTLGNVLDLLGLVRLERM